MSLEMVTDTWCGHVIRFVKIDGDWWAVLKDICDALRLDTWHMARFTTLTPRRPR